AHASSDRSMMLEVHMGPYLPNIDEQFEEASPYGDAFGTNSANLIGLHLDYQVFQGLGSLAIGAGIRYGAVKGNAIAADGSSATDETGLHLMPATLSLTYRFDWPSLRFGFPLVPYGKAGASYMVWWMTNGRGEVANAYDPEGVGRVGMGGTMGWHAGGGVQILLDWFAPTMALVFDDESGVNNSYFFAEYMIHQVNDFGSDTSLELSDEAFSLGLMFEF
ncbi:MAG: MXAN_2562 family outer membrane beta-barrel protein, partial [Myxococcota bacterium]|nr:MXAN_2562 family outer membrane beta-barrel protein [Myxococcota bacterium]